MMNFSRYIAKRYGSKNVRMLSGVSGIYILVAKDCIDYIGRSINIGRRLGASHHVFDPSIHEQVIVIEEPDQRKLIHLETALICQYNPPKNGGHRGKKWNEI